MPGGSSSRSARTPPSGFRSRRPRGGRGGRPCVARVTKIEVVLDRRHAEVVGELRAGVDRPRAGRRHLDHDHRVRRRHRTPRPVARRSSRAHRARKSVSSSTSTVKPSGVGLAVDACRPIACRKASQAAALISHVRDPLRRHGEDLARDQLVPAAGLGLRPAPVFVARELAGGNWKRLCHHSPAVRFQIWTFSGRSARARRSAAPPPNGLSAAPAAAASRTPPSPARRPRSRARSRAGSRP